MNEDICKHAICNSESNTCTCHAHMMHVIRPHVDAESATCAGVDPKSIVCEYFRAGQCTKGFKCKFSHDLAVERKGGKIDLFTDT